MTTTIVTKVTPTFTAALVGPAPLLVTQAEIWAGPTLLRTFNIEASSTLNVDRNSIIRRHATVVLVDYDNTITPTNASSIFTPYGNELKLYRGLQYTNGDIELCRLGTFGIEDVMIDDSGPNLVITITAYDRARAVQRAGFTDVYTVPTGSNLGDAIKNLISSRQTGLTFNYKFSPTTITTPTIAPIVYKPGEDPWAKATEMAISMGFELYFNTEADCVLLPIPNPQTSPLAWSYDEGPTQLATKIKRSVTRAKAANFIIRDGQGSGILVPVRASATDNNPSSPTYIGGPYGQVVDYKSSALYFTLAQAQAAADAELLKALGTIESLSIGAIPKPDHDVDDIIEVTRARVGLTSVYYVVDSFSLGFGSAGVLDMSCRAITWIAAPPGDND